MRFQDVTDILTPPTEGVVAVLGWVAFICLSAVVWLMRVREKERKAELDEWRTIARQRADKLDQAHQAHHAELTAERKSKEDMAREVITLLQSSTQVLEGLRNDAKGLEEEHRRWRDEVRRVHDECKAEIVRLSKVVEGGGGKLSPGDGGSAGRTSATQGGA